MVQEHDFNTFILERDPRVKIPKPSRVIGLDDSKGYKRQELGSCRCLDYKVCRETTVVTVKRAE